MSFTIVHPKKDHLSTACGYPSQNSVEMSLGNVRHSDVGTMETRGRATAP